MSEHLLLITLGPVQDFIAAARRTRDLWFGSHLLSELSRAAAAAIAPRGRLVFPALDSGDPELEPCDEPVRPAGHTHAAEPPLSIANKILAEVPAGEDVAQLAECARTAAQDRLRELAGNARRNVEGLLADDIDDLWAEQIGTLLEFCAAWVPIQGGRDGYRSARTQVEQAVAGRKNLREFRSWRHHRDRAPKSSLDGARDSVLRERDKRAPKLVRKYRLADNEQLDAVGVLKRCGGNPEQFIPLRNIAVASWLATAAAEQPQDLAETVAACRQVAELPRVRTGIPCTEPFGFDADLFFPDRWPALRKELELNNGEFDPVETAVRGLIKRLREPYPYVCCLAADGDHMGRTLDAMASAAEHRGFSEALARFAPKAREIVESAEHLGALVYAGGDDVLAFLPVSTALACAGALRQAFEDAMQRAGGDRGEHPTLSVGLGVGHTLTGMGDLLELARRAERLAKQQRNSLAVIVQKRGGGEDKWTDLWTSAPVKILGQAIAALGERLPAKKVSEIRERLRRSPNKGYLAAGGDWAEVLRNEVQRILARSHGGEEELSPEDVQLALPNGGYQPVWEAVDGWVNLMRVAMVFAAAAPRGTRSRR